MSHLIPIAIAVVAGLLMTRVFKKLKGVSPSRYLKKKQEEAMAENQERKGGE